MYAVDNMYTLDTTTGEWSIIPTSGTTPGCVFGHKAVAHPGDFPQILVFGGRSSARVQAADLYVFDASHNHWSTVNTTGPGPSSRYHHAMCASEEMVRIEFV